MGYGAWNDDSYRAAARFRRARGQDDFDYDAQVRRRPRAQWKAAPELEPYGMRIRESRDSAEHPQTTPIAIFLDVTGSMSWVPRLLQQRLSDLHGLLVEAGVPGPQLLFGAIGDEDYDSIPLQVGQFESDNRMDEQLRQIVLEGGGGGDQRESYALATYVMARFAQNDAWQRRGQRGHLFLIGDEKNKRVLSRRALADVLGVTDVESDLSVRQVYRQAQRQWNISFVLPAGTAYYGRRDVAEHWTRLVGNGFRQLEDPEQVCRLIVDQVVAAGRPSVRRLVTAAGRHR